MFIKGYEGYGCTDGRKAVPARLYLASVLFLTTSNLVFLLPICLAIYRRWYIESLVYFYNMFFSTVSPFSFYFHVYYNRLIVYKWLVLSCVRSGVLFILYIQLRRLAAGRFHKLLLVVCDHDTVHVGVCATLESVYIFRGSARLHDH